MIPTPDEERDLARSGWRRMPLAAEIVFFLLTAIAIAALFALCRLLHLFAGWITALVSIAVAEWLIRGRRFWRTGVESALWIGGLVAFIVSLPQSGKPEALLVVAAAAALAGWRLRNALAGTAAVVFVIFYLAARDLQFVALLAGLTIAVVAAIATTHTWRRPSTEFLCGVITVVAPVAAFVASRPRTRWGATVMAPSDAAVIAVFVVLAALELTIGARFRVRAPLIAAFACAALAIVEAHDFIAIAPEAELIVLGIVALGVAILLMRVLRGRTSGVVVTPTKRPELGEALQIASMLPMATGSGTAERGAVPPSEGGGRFGGGGASDRF
jgi:hypothetical protein